MVENPWLAAQYILTEPLDYLFNLGDERFNTLNFGVMGYGTGQSLLRYENFRYAENLDYVFYIFTRNDLENIYNTGLFYLGESGKLARKEALGSPWWMQFVSRLHISYLLLDISARLPMAGQGILPNVRTHIDRDEYGDIQYKPITYQIGRDLGRGDLDSELVANVLTLFQQLIHHWKDLVEANGGKFYIVLLPRSNEAQLASVLGEEFEVVNLFECFNSHSKTSTQLEWDSSSPYRFERDPHWNERGNQLAVVCLYRFLVEEIGFPVLPDAALREAFFTYYSSFEGWMPEEEWIKEVPVPAHVREGIRDKYLALEKHEGGAR